ncbi:MAG: AAA family ATPase [Desulfobacterium sp.]|nr:AAA family ATPase [Desulfobacterium sp.]
MDYFRILNLDKEPFSNSPEPEFFFQSMKHLGCLQKMELSVRLRRGLNVVIGDVGTGKTTLCRQLILIFSESEDDSNDIETHLLMDPGFTSSIEFLTAIAISFGIPVSQNFESEWQFKENIKKYLLQKGVDEDKTVVLIIDEGQKLPDFCIEILREFLNYETNEFKLLQIVIFAQREFEQILKTHKNFSDRVNLFYYLKPLNFRETLGMVRYRIAKAGNTGKTPSLFTYAGLCALYFTTKGYPRKIVTLCHQVILALIIQNRSKAGWFVVRSCAQRVSAIHKKGFGWIMAATVTALFVIIILSALFLFKTSDIKAAKEISCIAEFKKFIPGVQTEPVETGLTEKTFLQEAVVPIAGQVSMPEKTMPDLIGKLTIKDGEVVWRIMADFYGDFDNSIFQKVVLANPHINNLDKVATGEVLNLPAIAVESNPMPSGKYLVRVATDKDIRKIYELYNEYKRQLSSLEFIPYWNRREGLVFAVFLKNGYNSMESAGSTVDKLPQPLASNASILGKLDDDTLFFADRKNRRFQTK